MSRRLTDSDLQALLDAAYGGHVHPVDVVRLVEEVRALKVHVPAGTFIPCTKEEGEAIIAALKDPGVIWGPLVPRYPPLLSKDDVPNSRDVCGLKYVTDVSVNAVPNEVRVTYSDGTTQTFSLSEVPGEVLPFGDAEPDGETNEPHVVEGES